ncbi:MAG: division/cell wall cluster transcriptional repressor MraZ [Lachnospiraceae bacterium]
MYIGEYNHTIDSKSRLILPSKLREALGDEFVMTKGVDGCLFVYDKTEWAHFEEKLDVLSITNKESRTVRRFFISSAATVEVDKQGRFLVPANLRTYAGLEKEVVFAGCGRNIEIWNSERWNEMNNDNDVEEIMEYLDGIGLNL